MTVKRRNFKNKPNVVVVQDTEKTERIEKHIRRVLLAYANPVVQEELNAIREKMGTTGQEDLIPKIHKQIYAELYQKFFGELKL